MFELIKTVASLLKESAALIEKLKGRLDDNKKRRLAQTLHLVYIRLNECIVAGDQIIDTLDKFILNTEQLINTGRYQINVDDILFDDLVRKQIQNLQSLDDCLTDYSDIMQVLDTDLYNRLKQFVAYKGVGVNWMAALLERGEIPFDGLNIKDVEELTKLPEFVPWYQHVSVISRRIDENSFTIESLFSHDEKDYGNVIKPDQLRRLIEVLRRVDLKHHLVAAKNDMTVIKDFIVTHFSIVDLMIDVGSDQLKKRPPR
jgi:hypothetical protein